MVVIWLCPTISPTKTDPKLLVIPIKFSWCKVRMGFSSSIPCLVAWIAHWIWGVSLYSSYSRGGGFAPIIFYVGLPSPMHNIKIDHLGPCISVCGYVTYTRGPNTERRCCTIIWLTYRSHILSCISAGNCLQTGPAFCLCETETMSHVFAYDQLHTVETKASWSGRNWHTNTLTHTGCLGGTLHRMVSRNALHKNGNSREEKKENNHCKSTSINRQNSHGR